MVSKNATLPVINPYNLGQFFQSSYLVPTYQRNYSWTPNEVGTLMDDLVSFYDDPKAPFYLLGDVIIVTSKQKDFDFEIIDGQQRITSLVILFATLIRKLRDLELDLEEIGALKTLIYKSKRLQIRMSGKASESVLAFLEGTAVEDLPKSTLSQIAVIDAIETIRDKISDRFGEKPKIKVLRDFLECLQKSVYLSQFKLSDTESAFEFFERVNDRGRPLSKTDLLKNRLLAKVSDIEYENSSEIWADAEKRLLKHGREGSISYLMRQMIIADEGVKIKENDLFKKWKDSITDDESALRVFSRIETSSKALDLVLSGKNPDGTEDIYSIATSFMGFTQNVGVKLAAAELPKTSFEELSRRLQARALLSLFSLERSQTYESEVAKWANSIQKLGNSSTPEKVIEAVPISKSEIEVLLTRCRPVLESLRYGLKPGHTSRIRLLLALVNYELHLLKPINHYDLRDLLTTSKKTKTKQHDGYDIEHVGAKSTASHLGDQVHSLGNLTLFYSKDNRSLGAKDVEYKAESYDNSICFATKLLCEKSSNSDVEKAISGYRTATVDNGTWTIADVQDRFEMYLSIFESIIRRDLRPTP